MKQYWPIILTNIVLIPCLIYTIVHIVPEEKIYEEPASVTTEIIKDLSLFVLKVDKNNNLKPCEATRDSKTHRHPENWGVYAIDIHCEPYGKSMSVFAPKHQKEYVITDIGSNDILGDYIVLKAWALRYVFWHTKAREALHKWEIVHAVEHLWDTTLTGKTTWYHLHYEVWLENENVSPGITLWYDYSTNTQFSETILQDQRHWSWTKDSDNEPEKQFMWLYNLSRYYTVVPSQKKYYLNRTYEEDFEVNCQWDCFKTANGHLLSDDQWGKVVACPPNIKLWSRLLIEWIGEVTCQDRGWAIKWRRLDVWMWVGDAGVDRLYGKVTTYRGERQVYLLR